MLPRSAVAAEMQPGRKALLLYFCLAAALSAFYFFGRSLWFPTVVRVSGMRTVADIIEIHGASADADLQPKFAAAGAAYPPASITFIALKQEKILEVWAPGDNTPVLVATYPILAASGGPGPKLREGDRQVPEGLYRLAGLNPNSSFHLSMKINYPNEFDLRHAAAEGRTSPGSDIFIHGREASIGCLAMGDPAIEKLFVLVARTGYENVEVIMAPYDFRKMPPQPAGGPVWLPELYAAVADRMKNFTN